MRQLKAWLYVDIASIGLMELGSCPTTKIISSTFARH